MENNLVSIITPCYNGEKYISETIESVLKQTYSSWEMIIVDDGSIDESVAIVKKFQKRDSRIKLIKQKNAGSAAARNNGIKHAKGRYIALLDADDVWKSNFLQEQLSFMKAKNAICVFSSYTHINEKSQEILHPVIAKTHITIKDMRVMNEIGCLTGLYDSLKYGKMYLNESLNSIRDDYEYWYKIVALENRAYGNSKILAKYRVLSNSTTGNKGKLIFKQYSFYRNNLDESPVTAFINVIRWGLAGIKKFH